MDGQFFSKQTNKQASKRLYSLDIFKAISIILVLTTHLRWDDNERKLFLFPFLIEMGVPCFMMISGYIGAKTLKCNNPKNISECYKTWRTSRKIFIYSIPLVLVVSAELIMKYLWSRQRYPIFQTFFCGGVGPGSYYFPCLIQFVILFPGIYMIINKNREKGLILLFFATVMYEITQSMYGFSEESYRLLFFRYLFCVSYGCFLAIYESNKFYWYVSLIAVIIGGFWIIIVEYVNYNPVIFKYWRNTNVLADLFFAIIFKLWIKYLKNIRCPFMEYIGKNTYYIFLIQMVFFSGIDIYFYRLIMNRYLGFTGSIIVCIIGGVLFSLICKPLTKAAVGLYDNIFVWLSKCNLIKLFCR